MVLFVIESVVVLTEVVVVVGPDVAAVAVLLLAVPVLESLPLGALTLIDVAVMKVGFAEDEVMEDVAAEDDFVDVVENVVFVDGIAEEGTVVDGSAVVETAVVVVKTTNDEVVVDEKLKDEEVAPVGELVVEDDE